MEGVFGVFAGSLLPLAQGITPDPVEFIQIFCLNDIHLAENGLLQDVYYVFLADSRTFFDAVPAPPVIRTKGFLKTVGPNLYPPVGDHI